MSNFKLCWIILLLVVSTTAYAEQKKTLGSWDVHYIVVGTTFLTPEVAKAYGIVRSRYNALVNISVLDKNSKAAQSVIVEGDARNLLGTNKALSFKQVQEGDAIYYLAVLPFRNDEQYRFNIRIKDGNQQQTLKFEQRMYVD